MNLHEVVKVHIWQLSMKNTNIDKDNDYTMIHDGITVRKTKMVKLYDYFNQDYKIDNVVEYFDYLIKSINDDYEIKYSSLELSLDKYNDFIKQLENKFIINRNNIRNLKTTLNQIHMNINDTINVFENIDEKYSLLFYTLNGFDFLLSNISDKNLDNSNKVHDLNINTIDLTKTISDLYEKSEKMKVQIEKIQNNLNIDSSNKKDTLIQNIHNEYDKILSIIDHYHHESL